MFVSLFSALTLFFAAPDFVARWTTVEHDSINLGIASGRDDRLESCLGNGFQVRYRFEVRLCESRPNLFSSCKDTRVIIRTLELDPISENYKMVSDALSDREDPAVLNLLDRDEALREAGILKGLSLTSLGIRQSDIPQKRPLYVRVRLLSDCKGEYNETLARIGYFLSLGLIRFNESDSGWVTFTLEPSISK